MCKIAISTTDAPSAIGPYSQAIRAENLLFVSGQIPIDPTTGIIFGNSASQQAEQALKNLRAILEAAGTTLSNVVKTTVFLNDMDDFAQVNGVYAGFFSEVPPARSCVEVSRLPKGVLVEIEAIATI